MPRPPRHDDLLLERSLRALGSSLALLILVSACKKEEEIEWILFNSEEDWVQIDVLAEGEPGDPLAVDLHSTTDATLIGDVWIDPGSGPVGTVHVVELTIDQSYEDRVSRAEIVIESSERGSVAFDMERDSAQLWKWVLSLTSDGEQGEARTDRLTFRLYELVEVVPETTDDGGGLFGL